MTRAGCLLTQTATGWRVSAVGSSVAEGCEIGEVDAASIAAEVADYVVENELNSRSLLIALHANGVMVGEFTPPETARRSHTTLSYEFEQVLPAAAEEVVAEFVDHGDRVFGVAVAIADLLPLVDELESRGLRVCSIVPATTSAIQAVGQEVPLNQFDQLVWEADGNLEFVQLRNGRPAGWQQLPTCTKAVLRQLAMRAMQIGGRQRIAAIGLPPEVVEVIRDFDDVEVEEVVTTSRSDHLSRCARLILAGKQSPWFELRRGGLAGSDSLRTLRGGLSALLVAATLFLLTVCAVNWSVVVRERRGVRQLREQQTAAFAKVFPATAIPAGIVARMQSERTKLAGSHLAEDRVSLPTPALNVLARFLRGLPSDQPGTFQRVRIENGSLDAEVDLVSHAAANRLAAALREQGFEIDPPTTTQSSDNTVVTRLYANIQFAGNRDGGDE